MKFFCRGRSAAAPAIGKFRLFATLQLLGDTTGKARKKPPQVCGACDVGWCKQNRSRLLYVVWR